MVDYSHMHLVCLEESTWQSEDGLSLARLQLVLQNYMQMTLPATIAYIVQVKGPVAQLCASLDMTSTG